jgi:hypothetical protein
MLGLLRGVFGHAVREGAMPTDPTAAIQRARLIGKLPDLPDTDQFRRLLVELECGHGRDSRNCADLVRFLAYGHLRDEHSLAMARKVKFFGAG